jgi:hypothetical protein
MEYKEETENKKRKRRKKKIIGPTHQRLLQTTRRCIWAMHAKRRSISRSFLTWSNTESRERNLELSQFLARHAKHQVELSVSFSPNQSGIKTECGFTRPSPVPWCCPLLSILIQRWKKHIDSDSLTRWHVSLA